MGNSIISEIGGVTMKTLEEIKPVIDEAVASASNMRYELSDTRDKATDKDAVRMEAGISVQDAPFEISGGHESAEREEYRGQAAKEESLESSAPEIG